MATVANGPAFVGSGDEVPRDRLRIAILGRLRDVALMAGLYGKPDDNSTSLLQAMIKAAFVFVVDKEGRAKLDQDDVVHDLGRMLQENQLKLGSLNDSLLSALGEVLHYALEKWPRDDLKGTADHVDASTQCEIPLDILEGEVLNQPIDSADEEKAVPFLSLAELPQEPIERENEQEFPFEDSTVEGILPDEETGQRNFDHANDIAKEKDPVKGENHEDMDDMGSMTANWTEEDDGGEEYELSVEGEEDESKRKLKSAAVTDPHSQERKKIDTAKHQTKSVKNHGMRNWTKEKLAALNHTDYEFDGKVSKKDGRFKCTRCGKRRCTARELIDHINSHTGETPFQCTFCPKRYSNSASFRFHLSRGCKDQVKGRKNTGHEASGRKKDAAKK